MLWSGSRRRRRASAVALALMLTPAAPAASVRAARGRHGRRARGRALMYLAVTRRPPYVPPPVPAALAALRRVDLAAASEEILWRRVVLGELLRVGPAAAVAGSTLGFALVHRTRQLLHLGTGAAFGGLYLATGALAASSPLTGPTTSSCSRSPSGGRRPSLIVAELARRHEAVRAARRLSPACRSRSRAGEVVALLGPNGAGKSTALAVLLGLRVPDAGTARLFGADPRSAGARRRSASRRRRSPFRRRCACAS